MGVEPTTLAGQHFKCCAYTNSAIRAGRPGRELHPRITVLQTVALLLGDQAGHFKINNFLLNFQRDIHLKARRFFDGYVLLSQFQNLS